MHFNRGWVPYAERQDYLLEADVGVSAHHDHLEARFSFRTRVLDHVWAGLPSVVSSGDAIGELVRRRGLGEAVAPGDDEAFAAACAALLDDRAHYDEVAGRVGELAPSLRWSAVAEPLVRFCVEHADRPRGAPPSLPWPARRTASTPRSLRTCVTRAAWPRSRGACPSTSRGSFGTGAPAIRTAT